jgi:Domain of unknown function (DUF4331)
MKTNLTKLTTAFLLVTALPGAAYASSHMDAPLITLDPAANTTDVYAFVDEDDGQKSLVVALGVYPHQEAGIGPNKYNFDDNVLYEIHVAKGRDLVAGKPTISYQFKFDTTFKNDETILISYLGVVENVDDDNQNLVQRYTVTKVDWHSKIALGDGIVPPNNQGRATPFYNQDDNGDNPAKDGVAANADLDRYTQQTIAQLDKGYVAFAGQRDDGFFADVLAIFDLLQLRDPGQAKDSQGGFNIHLIALRIPIEELGGDQQIVGVYATTSRQKVTVLREGRRGKEKNIGEWVQVARQGNPLFNEALVAVVDKDLYSRTSPSVDAKLFSKYALNPELARLLNLIVFEPDIPDIETGRTDIAAIYIPDMIKVDLSTDAARLAGRGPQDPNNPDPNFDDPGFSRLSIFGNDVLPSTLIPGHPFNINGIVPGGWPNGRRFGDDVLDIAVTALISDLRVVPPLVRGPAGDNLNQNDIGYNKTFPYEGTPQNGRNHAHP